MGRHVVRKVEGHLFLKKRNLNVVLDTRKKKNIVLHVPRHDASIIETPVFQPSTACLKTVQQDGSYIGNKTTTMDLYE